MSTTAITCQHCYCLAEPTTAVDSWRFRCCQCGLLSPWQMISPSPTEREFILAREFVHDTIQVAFALDSGVDKGVRLADLKKELGGE